MQPVELSVMPASPSKQEKGEMGDEGEKGGEGVDTAESPDTPNTPNAATGATEVVKKEKLLLVSECHLVSGLSHRPRGWCGMAQIEEGAVLVVGANKSASNSNTCIIVRYTAEPEGL
ncbi:hypothetical protein KIPB_007170, partial [Kipferlia bialata]|eukprot:g7170.t1